MTTHQSLHRSAQHPAYRLVGTAIRGFGMGLVAAFFLTMPIWASVHNSPFWNGVTWSAFLCLGLFGAVWDISVQLRRWERADLERPIIFVQPDEDHAVADAEFEREDREWEDEMEAYEEDDTTDDVVTPRPTSTTLRN